VSGLRRPKAHSFPSQLRNHNRRTAWLKSLHASSLLPDVVILEEVETPDCLPDLEKAAIAHYRSMGFDLVNGTDGGEGTCGRTVSTETRARISEAQSRRVRTPEERKRMAEGQKRRAPFSVEHLANIRASQKLRRSNESPEDRNVQREATISANRARVWTDESRKKLSDTLKRLGQRPPVYRGRRETKEQLYGHLPW
jgi:hypothetical protein